MNVQFVSNEKGKVTAVQVPLAEWKELQRKAEAFDIANSIKTGLQEVDQIEKGEITAKSLEALLNEL